MMKLNWYNNNYQMRIFAKTQTKGHTKRLLYPSNVFNDTLVNNITVISKQ